VLLLVACSTPPVYLDTLEASDYASVDAVIERLDCNSYITTFHVGQGVSNELEALEVARAEGDLECVPPSNELNFEAHMSGC
jgi:hypothetical protein